MQPRKTFSLTLVWINLIVVDEKEKLHIAMSPLGMLYCWGEFPKAKGSSNFEDERNKVEDNWESKIGDLTVE